MPRMTYIKSIFGETISVQEGTIRTRAAFEQWWLDWQGPPAPAWAEGPVLPRDPGSGVDHRLHPHMIDAGIHPHVLSTARPRSIDDYNEESFYEDLENLRDSLNGTLNEAANAAR